MWPDGHVAGWLGVVTQVSSPSCPGEPYRMTLRAAGTRPVSRLSVSCNRLV